VQIDGAAVAGNKRLWGLAVPATTPTVNAPVTNGVVFEISDTDGALYGAVYSNGARTQTVTLARPSDGLMHRYTVAFRTSCVYFQVDDGVPAALPFPNPVVAALPAVVGSVNNVTAFTAAPLLLVSQVSVGDTGRNATQLSDGTYPWRKVQVGKNGGLAVKGSSFAATYGTFAAGATGTVGPVEVSEAGNVTFIIKNTVPATAFTGKPTIVLEQSDDGVSWGPLVGVRSDTNLSTSTHVLTGGIGVNGAVMIDCGAEGVAYVRARVTVGPTTAGMTVGIQPGGMPFSPTVSVSYPVRTTFNMFAVSISPTSTIEQLFNLTRASGTSANTTGTNFLLEAGSRYRIGSIVCSQVGHSTATRADTTFRLRLNNSGAATVSSNPVLWAARIGTPATSGAYETFQQTFPEGMELIGDGVAQFAFTYACNYTTNPPTLNISVHGYEY
jgi:hypothetical protein